MWKIIVLTLAVVLICVALMGVRVFFTKKGKFPNTHVGGNPALKKKGIHCAKTQDWEERNRRPMIDLNDID